MNKSERLFVRISAEEKRKFYKAARYHKDLSAFLLSSARMAVRYWPLIEEANKLGLKTSAMKVVEK